MKKNISISLVVILLIGLIYYLINLNASPSFIGTWEKATYSLKNGTWEMDTTQSPVNYIVSNKQIIITGSWGSDTAAWENVQRENIKKWTTEKGFDNWDEDGWSKVVDSIAKIVTNKQLDGWLMIKNLDDSPIVKGLPALPYPYVWTGKNELTVLEDFDAKTIWRKTK
jgi:hypothetical protein